MVWNRPKTEATLSCRAPRYHSEDACCPRNRPESTKPSRTASSGAWPSWCSFRRYEHENGLRQMTRFLMVSSNWDDSFGIQHLPSTIYALAETAWGENAVCSHTILSSQSGLSGSDLASRLIALTRAPLEPYGRAVRCGHRKFMLTNHNIYNYVRAKYFV